MFLQSPCKYVVARVVEKVVCNAEKISEKFPKKPMWYIPPSSRKCLSALGGSFIGCTLLSNFT